MPEFAVFADTGDEPQEVYDWLERLRGLLPFRVKIAHRDAMFWPLSKNLIVSEHSQIPAFFKSSNGAIGIGKRQCTKHWKIVPVKKKIRECLNAQGKHLPPSFVHLWHGISTDEISRAKDSREEWITHVFPLLDKRMSRQDCVAWLDRHGLEAPKSACVYCPYRSPNQWRKSKQNPTEWALITKVDALLNKRNEFLHSSCRPINEVDFSTEEERGQINMFNNECEGMCGV